MPTFLEVFQRLGVSFLGISHVSRHEGSLPHPVPKLLPSTHRALERCKFHLSHRKTQNGLFSASLDSRDALDVGVMMIGCGRKDCRLDGVCSDDIPVEFGAIVHWISAPVFSSLKMWLIFQPPAFQPFITDMRTISPCTMPHNHRSCAAGSVPLLSGWGGSYFYSIEQAPLSTVQQLNRKGEEERE